MGFTPVEGLMMGTRAGDLDLGAATFIMDKEMIGTKSASNLFNKQSGLLGITGVSSDMREIRAAAAEGHKMAELGLDMYSYRIKKYIGSYAAAMGGVDTIVFTGGIGEYAVYVREAICEDLDFIGIEMDKAVNEGVLGEEAVVSTESSKVKVIVVPTDEELVIARDTKQIVEELANR